MSQPYTGLHFHIVFTTKNRALTLTDDLAPVVRRELSDSITMLDGALIACGGMPDHLHLLVHLGPSTCLARFVEAIKGSSAWRANSTLTGERVFEWQEGYLAFIVCGQDVGLVAKGILQQEERHTWMSYQEEMLRLRKQDLRCVDARAGEM